MNDLLTERFGKDIKGVSSYDRLVVFGSFDKICYPKAMEGYLLSAGVRLVDYQKHFANELRLEMVSQVKQFAEEQKVTIEHVQSSVRKEDFVAKRVQRRCGQPGVVCVLSAMESCRCFKVRKNHESGYLELRSSPGKCLHYYLPRNPLISSIKSSPRIAPPIAAAAWAASTPFASSSLAKSSS